MFEQGVDASSDEGIVVSLIEGMIAAARVIVEHDLDLHATREALIDFGQCDAVKTMLANARPFHQEKLLDRRDELVQKGGWPDFHRTLEEQAELESIQTEIESWPTTYFTAEQRAMDAIREAAALLRKHEVTSDLLRS